MLVVVTHSPALAARFDRRYELNDRAPACRSHDVDARWRCAGCRYYRRTHVAVACGVAAAVAVLAGSLLVGHVGAGQPRGSRRPPARPHRLGRRRRARRSPTALRRIACHRPTPLCRGDRRRPRTHDRRRAAPATSQVYGVDERFFAFHGVHGDGAARSATCCSVPTSPPSSARRRMTPCSSASRGRPTSRSIRCTAARKTSADRSGCESAACCRAMRWASSRWRPRRVRCARCSCRSRGCSAISTLPDRVNTLLLAPARRSARRGGAPVRRDDAGGESRRRRSRADVHAAARVGDGRRRIGGRPGARRRRGRGRDRPRARESRRVTPVLTWLATRSPRRRAQLPYSLVTAIGPDVGERSGARRGARAARSARPADRAERVGGARSRRRAWRRRSRSSIYRWTDEGRLVTERATFRVAGVVPMRGLAIDRRLAPDYPGITESSDVADWDPPFPIDLKLVRPQDEDYWDQYRTTPKAFIPLAAGAAPVADASRPAHVAADRAARRWRRISTPRRHGSARRRCARHRSGRGGLHRHRRPRADSSRRRPAPPTSARTSRTSASF